MKNNGEKPLKDLAEYIVSINIRDLPEPVKAAARDCCVDTLGSGIGGADYEEVPAILRNFLSRSATNGENDASVWGTPYRTSVFQAALLNGILSHSLELDDVHAGSKTHIGAVVLPAAWSVAESEGLGGDRLLEAVVAGYETMARVGRGFGVTGHRMRGWHVSGTAGTFGAAAAAAKLLDLDARQTLSALGMAGTQSSGLWAFLGDGATSKKLHTGRAAENGVTAAWLAKSGMIGPARVLDAEDGGLYRATSEKWNIEAVSEKLGETYEILAVDRKPYSCCRSMHPAIDAVFDIRARRFGGVGGKKADVDEIRRISIRSYEVGVKQCGVIFYPINGSEARFSMRFGVAAAFIDGAAGPRQFCRERIEDPQVRELAEKIDYQADEAFTSRYPEHWGCSLTVEFQDGTRMEKTIVDPSGGVANPMSPENLDRKFTTLASPFLGPEKCQKALRSLRRVENLRDLSGLLSP